MSTPTVTDQLQVLDGIEMLAIRARAMATPYPELLELIRQIHSDIQHLGIWIRATDAQEHQP